jgi:methionyl-tRNA formyltransferase
MRPRVAFLGSPAFAVPSLEALLGCSDVLLVVTQPDRPSGRGRRLEPTPIRTAAENHGLPVRTWERGGREELERTLQDLALDVLVVVAFGVILKPSTLAVARCGAVNVHASLLPRWRGVAPIERAILAGDDETGVSLMVIDPGVDTGPVLAMRREPIRPDDTRVSLAARLADRGAALLAESLAAYVRGELEPRQQPETGITYARRLEKDEGRIDWSAAARAIADRVRGLYAWPGAFTRCGDLELKVHRVQLADASSDAAPGTLIEADARLGVRVACGTGTIDLVTVQLPGKPQVDARQLVSGRVLRPGVQLGG